MTTAVTLSMVREHEADRETLDESMEEFVKVGNALARIKKRLSYRIVDGYPTFEDWCNGEYHLGRRYVDNLIYAARERPLLPSPKIGSSGSGFWNEKAIRTLRDAVPNITARITLAKEIVKAYDASENGEKPKALTLVKRLAKKFKKKPKPKPPLPTFDEIVFQWTGQLNGIADILDTVDDADLGRFGTSHPSKAKALAQAIGRLEDSMTRVWNNLPAKARQV